MADDRMPAERIADVASRLHEVDAALDAVPLPTGLHARIVASTRGETSRRPAAMVLVVAMAAVVLAFVLGRRSAPEAAVERQVAIAETSAVVPPVDRIEPAPVVAGATYWRDRLHAEPGCSIDDDDALVVRGDCRLRLDAPSSTMDVWGGATIVQADHGVRVARGVVLFHVDPVPAGQPRVRIAVEAGAIEVIGTRFVVTQHEADGHVDLLEGSIAFVDRQGTTHAVAPGQRLRWTGADVVAAPAAIEVVPGEDIAAPRITRPARPSVDVDAALEQVAALRRAGRYDDAVEVLVRLRRSVDDPAVAEVLSFEEGTLRMHVDRNDDLCAYWRGHLARFGAGDHATSIRGHMTTAGCGEP